MGKNEDRILGVVLALLILSLFATIIWLLVGRNSRMELIFEKCRAGDDTACQIIYDEGLDG